MAIRNLQPTSNTTPDQGGTTAVTGNTNTGHGSTSCGASATGAAGFNVDSDAESKSCRWSSFQSAPSGVINSLRLQFSWEVSGAVDASPALDGGSAQADASFTVEYSLNGGSSWTVAVNQSLSVSDGSDNLSQSGSENISLSVGQNIAQVQVRSFISASGSATGGLDNESTALSSVTAAVTGIQLEVITADAVALLAMM